jgi:protein TonB
MTDKVGQADIARNANTGLATPAQAAPAPPVTVLPSSNADYLNNPAPAYPALSRRLGEQGRVVIRVLIDKDGKPQQGNIEQSSGYARLDQAALRAAMDWRYVPGRRDGKAQDMWFSVPIQFTLE